MQQWLLRGSREVARKTLNLDTLRSAPIPVAPLAEMGEAIRAIESTTRAVSQITKGTETATKRLRSLSEDWAGGGGEKSCGSDEGFCFHVRV